MSVPYYVMSMLLKQRNAIIYVPMEMSSEDVLARMNMIINKNK